MIKPMLSQMETQLRKSLSCSSYVEKENSENSCVMKANTWIRNCFIFTRDSMFTCTAELKQL